MKPIHRAPARPHSHARKREAALLEALENHVASSATASVVDVLRSLDFNDGYIAAALLAEAKGLIRGMPNKTPWAGLLNSMAQEAANGRI
ncbi:hypothetical protein OOJ09_25950 [Mesorhizobium qingshengii]|uniref:Uncharacterized protein n=1 Tax=Mesorhizobium qingshengii TaxID=1165689 RepID=A0ABT4R207_9HYPH|nr:hypothetical protein [Mesorhizobium qingshengii]MCZ8547644.1 hypothetical protein [Mesorhizobium qingshengii]